MTDFYLDVQSQEVFKTLKGKTPFEFGEGGVIGSDGWSVDILGDGQLRVISWSEDGEPATELVGGFLINLRSDHQLPSELSKYQVYPVTPIRVWA